MIMYLCCKHICLGVFHRNHFNIRSVITFQACLLWMRTKEVTNAWEKHIFWHNFIACYAWSIHNISVHRPVLNYIVKLFFFYLKIYKCFSNEVSVLLELLISDFVDMHRFHFRSFHAISEQTTQSKTSDGDGRNLSKVVVSRSCIYNSQRNFGRAS